jgi:integrase
MPRRGDGLVRRGKTWWLDFTHKGERYQLRLGRNISKTVAAELAKMERGKILTGESKIKEIERPDILFDDAVKEFLTWAHANKRPRTAEFYGWCFKALARSFAGMKLSAIHPFLIEKHKQVRISEGHRVAVNRELAALSSLFNRCIDWGKFDGANPGRKVKKLKEPLNRTRFLTEDEETALLSQCEEPLRTIVLVAIYAGPRLQSEALTLKKDNVDLQRRLLTVEAAYSKNGETETIPLHSKLVEALRARMQESRSEYVFEHPDGTRIRSVRTAFTNACQRAKLAGVTPHTLRHTFASRLGMTGANDRELQALGRWKDPKMIQRYTHLSRQHLAEALERIGSDSPTVFTTKKVHSS